MKNIRGKRLTEEGPSYFRTHNVKKYCFVDTKEATQMTLLRLT
jgi:hypothetical protein